MFVAVLVAAMNTTIYDHIMLAQRHPLHVCEVGVYVPDISHGYRSWDGDSSVCIRSHNYSFRT